MSVPGWLTGTGIFADLICLLGMPGHKVTISRGINYTILHHTCRSIHV